MKQHSNLMMNWFKVCGWLCLNLLAGLSLCAQEAVPPTPNPTPTLEQTTRLEIHFANPPVLELELTRYVTSDVHKPRMFEVMATLVEPLQSDKGLLILPAQTRLRLKAAVRPGSVVGHPGEIVLWLDPFLIGQGIEGFQCKTPLEAATTRLLPQLCEDTWRVSFDHQLDYAQTPEEGRPLILERKTHHEGLSGTRASRPPNLFFDPAGSNVDQRINNAVNRFQTAGIVYEIGAAVTGAVRFLFSKRNVFLPARTHVYFQLENTLRLVAAKDSTIRLLRFGTASQADAATPVVAATENAEVPAPAASDDTASKEPASREADDDASEKRAKKKKKKKAKE